MVFCVDFDPCPTELSQSHLSTTGIHYSTPRITNYNIPNAARGFSDMNRRGHSLPQRAMVSNDDVTVLLAPLPISIQNNESPTPRDPTSPQCSPRTYALLCIHLVICYASQTRSPLGAEHAERSSSQCVSHFSPPNPPIRPKKLVVLQAHGSSSDPSETAMVMIISVASLYLGIQYQPSDLS